MMSSGLYLLVCLVVCAWLFGHWQLSKKQNVPFGLCVLLLLIQPHQNLFAQIDTAAIRYGVFGFYGLHTHTAGFAKLPDVQSCCSQNYGRATSAGWGAGALFEYPLGGGFGIAGRVVYNTRFGAAFATSQSEEIRDDDGNITQAVIQYNLQTQLSTIGIEPLATVRLWKWLSLYVGGHIGVYTQRTFNHAERLISPNDVIFLKEQSRTRNEQSGTISNGAVLQTALTGGVSFELPVNRTGTVLPTLEAFYTYWLNSPVQGVAWSMNSIRLGASLRFSPYRTTELTIQELQQQYEDSLRRGQEAVQRALAEASEAKKKNLVAKLEGVRPVYFDDETTSAGDAAAQNLGAQTALRLTADNFVITTEKMPVTHSFPLLPMVFFNENSAVLPSRYKRLSPSDAAAFTIEAHAKSGSLGLYYHLLNVLGKRMKYSPQGKVILTGCVSEASTEKGNMRLAEQRAVAVANYLQDVWRIAPQRIEIKLHNLTTNAGASSDDMQRVEISTDTPELLKPVVFDEEKQNVDPPGMQIGMQISSGLGLKQWDLEIGQNDQREFVTLKAETGNTPLERYVWDIRKTPLVSSEDIAIRLSIDDLANNKFEAPILAVKVRQTQSSKKADVMMVLEQQQNEAELKRILDLVKQGLKPQNDIVLTAYPQSASPQALPQALSTAETRARTVANVLSAAFPGTKPTIRVVKSAPYSTTQPEGRMYAGCVQLEVRQGR